MNGRAAYGAAEVTAAQLREIDWQIQPSGRVSIADVFFKDLTVVLDGRGDIIELWSQAWQHADRLVQPAHIYESATDAGVVKCWHLHNVHTDQFAVTRGKLQLVLADLRPDSPTFGHVNSFIVGIQRPSLITIPPMVMHGWKALSEPEVIVVNFQSHTFDPADEYKFPWDCTLQDIWQPRNG